MGQKITVLASVLLAVALVGCAPKDGPATQEATPTPAAEAKPANATSCAYFGSLVAKIPTTANAVDAHDLWEELGLQFDEIALGAEGVTQDRMLTFASDWPDSFDIVIWKNEQAVDALNTGIASVERACVADGNDSSFDVLTVN